MIHVDTENTGLAHNATLNIRFIGSESDVILKNLEKSFPKLEGHQVYVLHTYDQYDGCTSIVRCYYAPVGCNLALAREHYRRLVLNGIGEEPSVHWITVEDCRIQNPRHLHERAVWVEKFDHKMRPEFFETWLCAQHGFRPINFSEQQV